MIKDEDLKIKNDLYYYKDEDLKIKNDLYYYKDELFTGIMLCDSGNKEWIKDGKTHREDGPAIICPNGNVAYYINNKLAGNSLSEMKLFLRKENLKIYK